MQGLENIKKMNFTVIVYLPYHTSHHYVEL